MANYVGGKGLKVEIDTSGLGTNFVDICGTSVDSSTNTTIDTFYTLCSDIANNVKLALDPTYSVTFKLDTDNEAVEFLLGLELTTGADAVFQVKITDPNQGATGTEYTFNGIFTDLNRTYSTETVVEFSGDLKIADGTLGKASI